MLLTISHLGGAVLIAGAITLILTHPGVVLFLLAICVALAAWFFVGLFAALGVRASGVLKQLRPQRRCGGYYVPGRPPETRPARLCSVRC